MKDLRVQKQFLSKVTPLKLAKASLIEVVMMTEACRINVEVIITMVIIIIM